MKLNIFGKLAQLNQNRLYYNLYSIAVYFILLSYSIYIITRQKHFTFITTLIIRFFFVLLLPFTSIYMCMTTFSFLFCQELRQNENEGIPSLLASYGPSLIGVTSSMKGRTSEYLMWVCLIYWYIYLVIIKLMIDLIQTSTCWFVSSLYS